MKKKIRGRHRKNRNNRCVYCHFFFFAFISDFASHARMHARTHARTNTRARGLRHTVSAQFSRETKGRSDPFRWSSWVIYFLRLRTLFFCNISRATVSITAKSCAHLVSRSFFSARERNVNFQQIRVQYYKFKKVYKETVYMQYIVYRVTSI